MRAYVAIGSNLGSRIDHVRAAIFQLHSLTQVSVLRVAPIYESLPLALDGSPGPVDRYFLNTVLEVETTLNPEALLDELHRIEKALGRKRQNLFEDRAIDLDIIACSTGTFQSPRVQVPHPRFQDRPFVVLPLLDLVPGFTHPIADLHPVLTANHLRFRTMSHALRCARSRNHFFSEIASILNVTPDSFSDGGDFDTPDQVRAKIERETADGIRLFDIGAESTRPDAKPVSAEEELARLETALSAVQSLQTPYPIRLSLDSRRPEVAARLLDVFPFDFINDVDGFRNPGFRSLLERHRSLQAIVMHSLSVPPKSTETFSEGTDPARAILDWWRALDLPRGRTYLDPGLGFGKTSDQNFSIVRDFRRLHASKTRLFVGHARKSFLKPLRPQDTEFQTRGKARELESLSLTQTLARYGAQIIRVHDACAHLRVQRAWHECDGIVHLA